MASGGEESGATGDVVMQEGFAALGLAPEMVASLAELGYEEPTPIQREAIPQMLAGRDVLGQAATGTGKTAAFALPMLQRVSGRQPEPGRPRALVLVPTRELAMQVSEAVDRYGKGLGSTVLPVYGGASYGQQLRVLRRGVQVVVATPGRAVDHVTRGSLDLGAIEVLVLDEADEMLDMGFAEDLDALLSRAPKERQTALFSATLAPRILALAKAHLRDPIRVTIARERTEEGSVPRVRQVAYVVRREHKVEALGRVLDTEEPTSAIVFCRTRLAVDEVTEAMNGRGYRAEALHGGFAQEQRERVLGRFREGRLDLLIATDVAARGLDVERVSHVVNLDVPVEPDAYVHRIGRTGRAGREGTAITFLEPREQRLLRALENAVKQPIAIETVPTAAQLANKRLDKTRAALVKTLAAGGLDAYRSIVEELAADESPLDVAAAALRMAHEAGQGESAEAPAHDFAEPARDVRFGRRADELHPKGPIATRGPVDRERVRPTGPRALPPGFARLFVGAGRFQSIRPGDLVGAITGETGLGKDAIGSIRVAERFSLVEVAEEHAEDVVRALRRTTVRGMKLNVRFDREA